MTPQNNHIDIRRYFTNGTYTIGVFLFNQRALCFTLEDGYKTEKVKGMTRIPAGAYELELKPIGTSRFDLRGWNMPPLKYYGMLRVKNVPNFSEILIHPGNEPRDTEGCVLVGLGANLVAGSVLGSAPAYMKIYQPIADELKKGERVTIQFHDLDRPAPGTDLVA